MMTLDSGPVVVLGMQRSGTSAVAGALSRLGLFLGADGDLFPGDVNNPSGYFEHRALAAQCRKSLAFYQMHASSVQPLPSNWQDYPQGQILREELQELLRSSFQARPLWGFKQPFVSLLMPLFLQVVQTLGVQPTFVVCVRNPLEVIRSEAGWVYVRGQRQLAPLGQRALGAWLNYTLGALKGASNHACTIVAYDKFLQSPRPILEEIVCQRSDWVPTTEQWNEAVQSVQRAWRHHEFDLEELQVYPELISRVWTYCLEPVPEPGKLSELLREFESWQTILRPPGLSGTRCGFAWHQPGGAKSVELPILPAGGWQTLQFKIDAPPRTVIDGLLYNKPCRVWIRRCCFITAAGKTWPELRPGPGSNLTEINGIQRLEGAYEAQQLGLVTPQSPGPYILELEILLESGPMIVDDAASRVADRLHQCAARASALRPGGKTR